jgi:hypothetical protein
MSYAPTSFRHLARGGWGGRAAGHFRGLLTIDTPHAGEDPQVLSASGRGQVGTVVYRSPGAAVNFSIIGVTRDSAGAILGACRVELYPTARDVSIAETVSDGSGNFAFDMPGTGPFYLVAYKQGSPDVAGTTVNTILPVVV